MPRTIEPIDCSDAWEAIENPPIVTISPEQWLAIEAAAAQAGEAGRATGDLYRWGLAAHDRLIALAEMPGAGILSLVSHLLMLRRDDLLESILTADYDGEIVHELVLRSAEVEADREKKAGKHCAAVAADKKREQRWEDAQGKPQETLGKIAEIVEADPKTCKATLEKIATLLGINCQRRKGADYAAAPNRNELREMIGDRIATLEGLASPAPGPLPVVITAGPPAPGPQDASLVLADLPLLTAEALLAEAMDPQRRQPTTRAAIDGWHARPGMPWQQWFNHLRDHLGPSAAAAIAEATGAPFPEVKAHSEAVWARHEADLAELRAAYPTLDALLADALQAPGWEWLSAGLGVGIEALWGLATELARTERPGAL